jgi:ABC-type multidrug transport system ATPase subunit
LEVVRGGRTIVARVSLELAPDTVGVVEGASGSGKSTLLRAIATLIPFTAEELALDGRSARSMPPSEWRRRVAYVPQLPRMFEGTVEENLRAGPRFQGLSPEAAQLASLLDQVGLPRTLLARSASELSGGERLRVGLARSLANEPRVLLLDEPTSALDPEASNTVLERILGIARSGRAVLVVTHVVEHARRLGGARFRMTSGVLSVVHASEQEPHRP